MAFAQLRFYSATLGLRCSLHALLPAPRRGQQTTPEMPAAGWPVLYLLHGLSDDHTMWTRRTAVERYAESRRLAVIMPAVARSFYQDMYSGPRYWTFLSEELPSLARSFFRLSDRREDNFVAGLSMGGYGAMRLALAHPDRFAAAASFSGAVDLAGIVRRRAEDDDLLNRRETAGIFGPDAQVAGSDADLFHLAERVAAGGPRPKLDLYCGTSDYLYPLNLRFREHLRRLGLDCTWTEDDGGHTWDRWDTQIERFIGGLEIG